MLCRIHYFITKLKTKIDVIILSRFKIKRRAKMIKLLILHVYEFTMLLTMLMRILRTIILIILTPVASNMIDQESLQNRLDPLPPNYSILIFTHLKLCLADAIHNFKWVKIIQIWQNGGQRFSNLARWCHILS